MSAGFKFVSKEVEEHSNNDEMIVKKDNLEQSNHITYWCGHNY